MVMPQSHTSPDTLPMGLEQQARMYPSAMSSLMAAMMAGGIAKLFCLRCDWLTVFGYATISAV